MFPTSTMYYVTCARSGNTKYVCNLLLRYFSHLMQRADSYRQLMEVFVLKTAGEKYLEELFDTVRFAGDVRDWRDVPESEFEDEDEEGEGEPSQALPPTEKSFADLFELEKYNPYHYPKGHPKAGQFAPAWGGEGVVRFQDKRAMEAASKMGRGLADVRYWLDRTIGGTNVTVSSSSKFLVAGSYDEQAQRGIREALRQGWLQKDGRYYTVTERGAQSLGHLNEVNRWTVESKHKVAEREAGRLKRESQRKAALTLDEAMGRMRERMKAVEDSKPPIDLEALKRVGETLDEEAREARSRAIDETWAKIKDMPLSQRVQELILLREESANNMQAAEMKTLQVNSRLQVELPGSSWKDISEHPDTVRAQKSYWLRHWEHFGVKALMETHQSAFAEAILPKGVEGQTDLGATYAKRSEGDEYADDKMSSTLRGKVDNAAEWLNAHLDPSVMQRGRQVPVQIQERAQTRAFWREPRQALPALIALAPSDSESTVVHEYGHHLEHALPNARAMAQEFLRRRTAGEKEESLRKLSGNGYDPDEKAKPDKFISPYVGKIYDSGHTEVVSMGVQYMRDDPLTFYRRDPEHFLLTASLLWGDTLDKKGAKA